jgi:Xaa-Pro aminopeptidase
MQKQQLDLLLLTSEHDVSYFSGFFTRFWQSPTRPWFLLVPQSGDPVAVIPSIGEHCMSQTWIKQIYTWSSPNEFDEGIGLLVDTINRLTSKRGRIGMPMGRESHLRMPINDFEDLIQQLDKHEWVDANNLLQRTRMIKSSAEIEKIHHVCQLASDVFENATAWLHTGMTDIDVFREFKIKALQAGVDDVSYLVGGSGAGGYEDIISPASDRTIVTGDVLILDTGCVWDGYFCDFDRNYCFGVAAPAVNGAYQRAWDATEAGFAAAKPGASFADLYHEMNTVLSPGDINDNSNVGRLGHGLGTQLTEPASITSFDTTILETGMVITLEPGLTYDGTKMMVHEENIVITKTGARYLSRRAPKDIIEITD